LTTSCNLQAPGLAKPVRVVRCALHY
jgi:hypothetical protein